jgi:hypothetical protein
MNCFFDTKVVSHALVGAANLQTPTFAKSTQSTDKLLLCLEHNLVRLHLVKQIVTFHCLAQRHDLVGHESTPSLAFSS